MHPVQGKSAIAVGLLYVGFVAVGGETADRIMKRNPGVFHKTVFQKGSYSGVDRDIDAIAITAVLQAMDLPAVPPGPPSMRFSGTGSGRSAGSRRPRRFMIPERQSISRSSFPPSSPPRAPG